MTHKVNQHPLATNKASDGARPPRSAAASGRLVSSAPARRRSLLGSLGRAAPKPNACSSDGDTAIERLGEVVTWLVLVWFGRQRGMKTSFCHGLDFVEAPWVVYSVLGAVGSRAAADPVALPLEIDGSRLRNG